MSLLKVNEVQNYNGSSLTLTASTVSTSAQLNTGGNISVTGSINVSDDSTTRSNLGLGSIATQDSDNVTVTGGTATLGALTVSGLDSGDLVRITQTGSGNALVVEDSTNPDSTPFVVDANGNVGIGTSSPSRKLEVSGSHIRVDDGYGLEGSGSTEKFVINNGYLTLFTNTTERMRIDSSGNVLVGNITSPILSGKASVYTSSGTCATLKSDDSTVSPILSMWGNQTTGNQIFARFATDSNAQRGTIVYNRGSGLVAYNTTSDYRAKKDVKPIVGATNRLMQLNPVSFSWNDNEARIDGFIAHEAQEIVPEAVTGAKDAMRTEEYAVTPAVLDDDGNVVTEAVIGTREVPDYQGIDQSKLVPLLTAALQESITIIESQQSQILSLSERIEALETE
jgi:hypothetical protein